MHGPGLATPGVWSLLDSARFLVCNWPVYVVERLLCSEIPKMVCGFLDRICILTLSPMPKSAVMLSHNTMWQGYRTMDHGQLAGYLCHIMK